MQNNPVFSFLLITYNQERFVEEAFLACVGQNFDDYEIIISDDNSTDGTWGVIERMVDDYRKSGGRIPVTINRNEVNQGIGGNFQKAAELSSGEWLLMAAGDDVSLPNRLTVLWDVIRRHPDAYGVNTGRFFVDEALGNPRYVFERDYLLGADSAWRRDLFFSFQPLDKRVMSEDHILNLRALLLGEMVQVDRPTIKYRVSSQNVSLQKAHNAMDAKRIALKKKMTLLNLLEFQKEDLRGFMQAHQLDVLTRIEAKLNRREAEAQREKESYEYFIGMFREDFWGKMKYVFTPSRLKLHSNIVSRIYNVLNYLGVLKRKPLPKKNALRVLKPSNQEYVIRLEDYATREGLY